MTDDPRPLRRAAAIAGAVALGLFALLGCRPSPAVVEAATPETPPAVPVETLRLTAEEVEDVVWVSGQVEPFDEVTLSAEIAGRVSALGRDLGDEVQPGEPLVSLDDRAVKARIRKIEARLAQARTDRDWAAKELARSQRLFSTEIASQTVVEASEQRLEETVHAVEIAEADLEEAEVELARSRVVSPLRGRVARRHISVGEYVTPGSKLFNLVGTEKVKLALALAESDVARVAAGAQLQVILDALPGQSFVGEVRAVAPAGHPQTRTFRVELELDNPSPHPLKPGMSGRARLVRRSFAAAVRLPEEALVRRPTDTVVYLADGGRAHAVAVEELTRAGSTVVVEATGLAGGECVIRGQSAVVDGGPVEVLERHDGLETGRLD